MRQRPRAATTRWLASASLAGAAALSLVVLFAPEAPGPDLVDLPGLDKAVHAGVFALLAATARWRFGRRRRIAVGLAAYAVLSELVQAVVLPRRSGDLLDVVADLAGAGLAWWASDAWSPSRAGSVPPTPPSAGRGRTP